MFLVLLFVVYGNFDRKQSSELVQNCSLNCMGALLFAFLLLRVSFE